MGCVMIWYLEPPPSPASATQPGSRFPSRRACQGLPDSRDFVATWLWKKRKHVLLFHFMLVLHLAITLLQSI